MQATEARAVLQLIPSFAGGGAETQLAYLCAGLVRRGWRVDVLHHLTGGPNEPRFRASGAAIHTLSARGNYDPAIFCQIRRAIRTLEPDLVQTWLPMMDLLGGVCARVRGIPWVMSERSDPPMLPPLLKLSLRERLARGASAVVSNSPGGDRHWARILPDGVLRAVIRNALPLEEIDAAKPATALGFGLDDSRPLIVYVGRLNADKNVAILVDALARVVAATDAVALLCGAGPDLDSIRERVEALGIAGRVVAPGFIAQPIPLLKRAALAISLSRYEGMPNSVMEAAAAGCPQVLSDIPAHRELLDDSAALFVDASSASCAAEAMIAALRDPRSAAQRAAIARERSRAWSIANMALAYEQVYEQVLERSRRPR